MIVRNLTWRRCLCWCRACRPAWWRWWWCAPRPPAAPRTAPPAGGSSAAAPPRAEPPSAGRPCWTCPGSPEQQEEEEEEQEDPYRRLRGLTCMFSFILLASFSKVWMRAYDQDTCAFTNGADRQGRGQGRAEDAHAHAHGQQRSVPCAPRFSSPAAGWPRTVCSAGQVSLTHARMHRQELPDPLLGERLHSLPPLVAHAYETQGGSSSNAPQRELS